MFSEFFFVVRGFDYVFPSFDVPVCKIVITRCESRPFCK